MNTRNNYLARIAAVALLCSLAAPAALAGYTIPWLTVDGGGHMFAQGGAYMVSGTAGQHDAGVKLTGGQFALTGGFWPVASATAPCGLIPGDLDGDNDVDLIDFSSFQVCFTGSAPNTDPGCDCADLDGNGRIDLVDFTTFATNFTG